MSNVTNERVIGAGVHRMPDRLAEDSKHWRDRAAAMRALVFEIADAETKRLMLKLADDYDKLADRAEIRTDGGKHTR